jgi:hypothetical protein
LQAPRISSREFPMFDDHMWKFQFRLSPISL